MVRSFLLIVGMWWFTETLYATELKVKLIGDSASLAKIQKVLPKLQKVLNSPELEARIIERAYTSTSLNGSQIAEKLLIPVWDIELAFKMNSCRVLGWTNPGIKTIYFNTCNFARRDEAGIAGTICHETSHKLGFDHKSAKDLTSVPYSFGKLCAELYGQED